MTKFQCHTSFLSEDIKQNVLLSSYLGIDDIINFKIYLGSASKANGCQGKIGEDKNTKIWISWTKRAYMMK